MRKNKKLLILNVLYTSFACLFFSGSFLGGFTNNIYIILFFMLFILLSIIGLWLLYFNKNAKFGWSVLKINYILKYIFTLIAITLLILLIYALQSCFATIFNSENKEVPMKDKLRVIVVFVPLFLIATLHFICVLRFISRFMKGKLNQSLSIIYASINIVFAFAIIVDLVLLLTNKNSLIVGYIKSLNISNAENSCSTTPLKVIFGLGGLAYACFYGFKSYLIIRNIDTLSSPNNNDINNQGLDK